MEREESRREFIRRASMLVVAGGFFSLAPLAPGARFAKLDATQARNLMMAARTLFPHDFLSDGYYMNVVAAIDAKMSDAAVAKRVSDGLMILGADFSVRNESSRESAMRYVEKNNPQFFSLLHGESINGIYGNKEVWKMLGFEGSSVEHGGYLERGFNDIAWLPKS